MPPTLTRALMGVCFMGWKKFRRADDLRAVGAGWRDFGFGVNLDQRIEPGGGCGRGEGLDFMVRGRPHNDEDRARAGLPGLQHLNGVKKKILPNAGSGGWGAREM